MDPLLIMIILILCILMIALIYAIRTLMVQRHTMREELLKSEKRQQEMMFEMQKSIYDELYFYQQRITDYVKNDLQEWNEINAKRIMNMEKNMNASMLQGYEKNSQTFGRVLEQMGKLDESQQNLKRLSESIVSIQNLLYDKKTRGIYGEIELYSLLENAMGVNDQRYAKQYKLSNNTIADAVLFMSEPLHMICIDSKFPLENYNRIMDSDGIKQKRYHNQFVSDVKKHIKAISEKYIISQETADFAYMFIPAEAVFSYIYGSCEEVVQYSYEQKVYIVSPTTLMAYITAMKAIYLGVERNENIEVIQQELKNLKVEFDRFEKRYLVIDQDFEKCYQDMKQLHITAKKLLHRFEEIEHVEL